jgi:acetylornithine deacetylase/succinyl-diaminopimelate desuccinylase-like protein
MRRVLDFIDKSSDRYVEELSEYLAIPSISALPEHVADMRRGADWTAEALRRCGLQHVRVIETEGHPIVYGDWLDAPGAPTILCYGHYDVQPADPAGLWVSPPFQPTTRDGRIYARGATDDKGQLFIHVKAIEAHLSQTGRLPVNVKMLIEGEEEVGGRHLEAFVRDRARFLASDVVVNSDSAMLARGVPSITYALRGLVYFQLDVRGTSTDLHSGSFGGTVANSACVLAEILASLKDRFGRVTIPGFYDDVRPIASDERAAVAALPFDERQYREGIGAAALFGEPGYTTLERQWMRPTLDVHGLLSGFTGEGSKTVIPAVAMAKVSMRLVPAQDPARIGDLLEAHLATVAPRTVSVTVTRMHGGKPWATSPDHPFVRAAARAMARGFGRDPVFIREGGSNPIVPIFEEVLGVPTVMFGIGLPDENPHAPNEHLDLDNFHRGVVAAAHLYEEIGRTRAPLRSPLHVRRQ